VLRLGAKRSADCHRAAGRYRGAGDDAVARGQRAAGFTIIELMVTVSIFAILVALTVPTMRIWIANTKVRAVADSLQNGIRLAQAESERLSRQVVFALTTSNNPTVGFTAATSGPYWAIQTVPLMTGETPTLIASGVLTSAGSTVTITAGSGQTALCFNSLGRLVANASPGPSGATCVTPSAGNLNSAQPLFTYIVSMAGADHNLQVEVAMGGQLHLCDPSQTLSSTNPYGC
jgi:type IV fimbrial biogenesis protein FimT